MSIYSQNVYCIHLNDINIVKIQIYIKVYIYQLTVIHIRCFPSPHRLKSVRVSNQSPFLSCIVELRRSCWGLHAYICKRLRYTYIRRNLHAVEHSNTRTRIVHKPIHGFTHTHINTHLSRALQSNRFITTKPHISTFCHYSLKYFPVCYSKPLHCTISCLISASWIFVWISLNIRSFANAYLLIYSIFFFFFFYRTRFACQI